ncbi:hypothetical protein [Alcaligenes faecalis]|uniref:hypothetical protein n=1 Tax=Alcaligenes faecalis TaxID=511 RepID=UPI001EF0B36C|nr:hypothetical protein [Alcaligenes faecalis]ULH05368.1 hypothetical protein MF263_11755 [Alcaligenes faecalis]
MTALANLFMWAGVLSIALLADKFWVRSVRPPLAAHFGWEDLPIGSETPTSWCLGMPAAFFVIAVVLKFIAPAAGF